MFSSDLNHGRGILVYVKECLGATDYKLVDPYQEYVWCKLSLVRSDELLIGCIYRSPHSNADNNHNLQNILRKVCAQKPLHVLI